MPTLYALLVGINDYPNPHHVLRGCVNDVQQLHNYLESYCDSMGFTYQPLILTDAAATRQAVIDGFNHFEAAEKVDACLFHFSGHGSRCPAPEAFWDFEPDHYLESIVCWDSREPGGYDLMDKELSFLSWRAAQDKELPFLTIMDCCHSGRMRNIEEEVAIRTLREADGSLPATQFLGLEHFKKTSSGQLSPPLGRRVHLAAARDTELAREVLAGGQQRGIFTYCLIEALQAIGPLTSYADLLHHVNLRIRNAVADQSAQLEATFTEDRNRGFLFSRIDPERPAYLVAWDRELDWVLHAGALHGIPAPDGDAPTILELTDDGHRLIVESVLADRSKVSGMERYDPKRAYVAIIRQRARPKLDIAFAPDSDPEGVAMLTGLIQRQAPDLFRLRDTANGLSYLIHARNGAYFLSRPPDPAPLFQPVPGYDQTTTASFLQKLDQVANWQQVLDLHNPDTGIQDAELEIELYRVTDPGNGSDDAPVESVDWQAGAAVYRYTAPNLKPAFQLKVRNAGKRPLWVGILYLGSDFSTTNALLPKQALQPAQEVWAADVFQNYQYRTIPLQIDQADRLGIDEYIKILCATEELNTELFCQKGLSADFSPQRSLAQRQQMQQRDWAARTVWLRIERQSFNHTR